MNYNLLRAKYTCLNFPQITRTDLYEDTGKSLSPGIDLGQIEGGYIYGQGLFTTEKIVHDKETGKLLTNGTWVRIGNSKLLSTHTANFTPPLFINKICCNNFAGL